MQFTEKLEVDIAQVCRALGCGDCPPDDETGRRISHAARSVTRAAIPRWVSARFELARDGGLRLAGSETPLPGRDIAAHLDGCGGCLLIGVTIGAGVDGLIRAAEAADIADAVLADAAASVLAEQYADFAQEVLAREAAPGSFLTGRFSPGYGDFPIEFQRELVRLTDAPRAIGLTANESSILIPRKSVTALLGIAGHPVTGRLAGCESCALREGCDRFERGLSCAKPDA